LKRAPGLSGKVCGRPARLKKPSSVKMRLKQPDSVKKMRRVRLLRNKAELHRTPTVPVSLPVSLLVPPRLPVRFLRIASTL
jgi:hypothetical protein